MFPRRTADGVARSAATCAVWRFAGAGACCARVRQRGVSIITAIFVLLMLSGVAAYVVSLSGSQHAGSGMDITGARVYQAARAGAEWGVWNAVKGSAYCLAGTDTQTLATGAAGALAGTLAPFTVTVSCTTTSHLEGATTVRAYAITATACNQGAVCPALAPAFGYVERQVTMSAWE